MNIRTYIRCFKKFFQQRFNKKLNINLFVSRRLNYVHLSLDMPLLSTSSWEHKATIKENRDPKYLFIFPRLIHTTKFKYDYITLEKKDI